jgi:hypothetical protein
LCTGVTAGGQGTDGETLVAGACFVHCTGVVVTRCQATLSGEEHCIADAEALCSEAGTSVESSAFVPDCGCLYANLAQCAPSFFQSTACHYQCAATPTRAGCSPNLDETRCEEVAARNCGGADQVLRRHLVVGCACTDDDPACGHPNWLSSASAPEPAQNLLPSCFLRCQNGTRACLNQSPSADECLTAADNFCSTNASQRAEHEYSADCPCTDSSCLPAWWTE